MPLAEVAYDVLTSHAGTLASMPASQSLPSPPRMPAGIAGITNMIPACINAMLRSIADLPEALPAPDALVVVASSGQESQPPVSRTIHEKVRGKQNKHFDR